MKIKYFSCSWILLLLFTVIIVSLARPHPALALVPDDRSDLKINKETYVQFFDPGLYLAQFLGFDPEFKYFWYKGLANIKDPSGKPLGEGMYFEYLLGQPQGDYILPTQRGAVMVKTDLLGSWANELGGNPDFVQDSANWQLFKARIEGWGANQGWSTTRVHIRGVADNVRYG
ncbi:MAG: hypothetical protein L5656_06740 [Thermanaeromonas sp.]|uniref:hypothetical protein n=1 Tax=Thermanaeromonas sp. TaxID=2003697 RepID=UPI002440AEC7|nr:hypothetical protein [Thermanaeromonas sp.]MCG0278213.1 hypothetical protein [Thermanaeromonas sp.]